MSRQHTVAVVEADGITAGAKADIPPSVVVHFKQAGEFVPNRLVRNIALAVSKSPVSMTTTPFTGSDVGPTI